MEPLSTAAIAVATLILKKALEKTGEKLGEAVSHQAAELLQLIQRKNLPQSKAIAQADQPIDAGRAVLELDTATKSDPELAQSVANLAGAVQAEPALAAAMPAYAAALQTAPPSTTQNFGKLAESLPALKNVFQGNTFNAPVTFN
ncbi:hypothetical protein H6F76_25335 [Leptolyngbya sp. FACHB-321]|uniref:hypothetical protein n=1 Tax=Leptolyngbya sp. FACHB-321 TaxID=2692807 RepID=UPI0016840799|nr:hypothetical protein [Leptolyngbya sp. FACHB-321]MBD2038281.1 hypothetical protein [Leptolyngbya sp. FACHB-321]